MCEAVLIFRVGVVCVSISYPAVLPRQLRRKLLIPWRGGGGGAVAVGNAHIPLGVPTGRVEVVNAPDDAASPDMGMVSGCNTQHDVPGAANVRADFMPDKGGSRDHIQPEW